MRTYLPKEVQHGFQLTYLCARHRETHTHSHSPSRGWASYSVLIKCLQHAS